MKQMFAIICLLLSSVVSADSANDTTLEQVAVYALKNAFNQPNGQHWEYGGLIIYHNGKLGFSQPTTMKQVDGTMIDPDSVRDGDVLMGIYHTHPCQPVSHYPKYFSHLDMRMPFHWHVPTFILDECSGDVHEFDPLVDDPSENGDIFSVDTPWGIAMMQFLTYGRVVGNIGAHGVNIDEINSKQID